MEITYLKHLDYRQLPRLSWRDCGFEYDTKLVQQYEKHPEWFDYNPPFPLYFPQELSELGIYPYSEFEIQYLESELGYNFPQAFKEILFLFGGKFFRFDEKNISNIRIDTNGKKKPIGEDVNNLKIAQRQYALFYERTFHEKCPKDLFLTCTSEGFYTCVISNKQGTTPVYENYDGYVVEHLPLVDLMESNLETVVGSFRKEMEKDLFSNYTSGQSAKLLVQELKKHALFNNILILNDEYGVQLRNFDKNLSCYILIEYDKMPPYHYEHKLIELDYWFLKQSTETPIERMIFSYNFREVINRREYLVEKIIERLKSLSFFNRR